MQGSGVGRLRLVWTGADADGASRCRAWAASAQVNQLGLRPCADMVDGGAAQQQRRRHCGSCAGDLKLRGAAVEADLTESGTLLDGAAGLEEVRILTCARNSGQRNAQSTMSRVHLGAVAGEALDLLDRGVWEKLVGSGGGRLRLVWTGANADGASRCRAWAANAQVNQLGLRPCADMVDGGAAQQQRRRHCGSCAGDLKLRGAAAEADLTEFGALLDGAAGRRAQFGVVVLQVFLESSCSRVVGVVVLQVLKDAWRTVERVAVMNRTRKRRGVVQFPWELAKGSVGYWPDQPIVCSRVVASFPSDSCFATCREFVVYDSWSRFDSFEVDTTPSSVNTLSLRSTLTSSSVDTDPPARLFFAVGAD
ncbi:hypothetical protein Taro_000959 [Colocasia esculenta]|uniref:Uncharacterized protein n=1 Tax=Colocasia esculenta TaxID=4460 RepID=A0A843T9K2_COLES|nr:hypothetical protein [Colocasia esculenta]